MEKVFDKSSVLLEESHPENSLILTEQPNPSFQVFKIDCFLDKRLSLKAKGLLAVLQTTISHPLYRGTPFNVQEIQILSNSGRDGTYAALKELEEAGYVKQVVLKEKGKIVKRALFTCLNPTKDNDVKLPGEWELFTPPCRDFPDKEKADKESCNNNTLFTTPLLSSKEEMLPTSSGASSPIRKRELAPEVKELSFREKMGNGVIERSKENEKAPKEVVTSPFVKSIIDFWGEMGLRKHKDKTTNVYKATVHTINLLLHGTFFESLPVDKKYKRKYTKEEIKYAIKNFALAATSPDYLPTNPHYKSKMKGTAFVDFVWISDFASNGNEFRSRFLRYLEGPPKLVGTSTPAVKPESEPLFLKFKLLYKQTMGGIEPSYTWYTENKLALGANKLLEFHKKLKDGGKYVIPVGINELANLMYKALSDDVGDETKLEAGHFCSERTFNKVLPSYLYRQAVTKGENA